MSVMEVTVQSVLQNEAQGRVTVACDPDDTVDSLISAFCTERGVRQKKDYVLRTRKNELLVNTKTIVYSDIDNGETVYLTSRGSEDSDLLGCNNWWLMAGVALMVGTVGLIAIIVLKVLGEYTPEKYGIVIDAGSTHTQVLVFAWRGGKYNGTGLVEQVSSCKNHVPISSFDSYPAGAGPSIKDCVERAASDGMPNSAQSATPVYLGATAGMRLLNRTNPMATILILDSIRSTLRGMKFVFSDDFVQIISGREEGSYSWVTVNYIKGTFGVTMPHHVDTHPSPVAHQEPSVGALDMGGASTQITFEPRASDVASIPAEYVEPVLLYGKTYRVYTDSFLCYGKSMAELRFLALLAAEQNTTSVKNPCAPRGHTMTMTYDQLFSSPCASGPDAETVFGHHLSHPAGADQEFTFSGESNSIQCQVLVKKMFDKSRCPYGNSCSWNGHYLAPVTGKFMGFSAFYYVLKYYNFTDGRAVEDRSLSAFQKAVVLLCTKSWDQVKVIPVDRPGTESYNCFDGHYVMNMLTDGGYHFNESTWDNIMFEEKVEGTSIGWAMGYMLNRTNTIVASRPERRIDLTVFISLLIIFSVLVILSVAFACYAKKAHSHGGYRTLDGYGSV